MVTAIRICGMVLVVFCTTAIGFSMAMALSGRVRELTCVLAALTGLEGELSYSLAPPDEAVARLEERESFSAAFIPACTSLCRRGTPFPQAWRQAVEQFHGALSAEDAAIVASLADTLGQCNLEEQLSSLTHVKSLLQLQLNSARTRSVSHGRLYRTMGLLAGAFVVIFFI